MMKSADVSTSFVSPGVVVRRGLHFLPVCVSVYVYVYVCVCACVYVRGRDVRKMLKFLNGLFCGLLSWIWLHKSFI